MTHPLLQPRFEVYAVPPHSQLYIGQIIETTDYDALDYYTFPDIFMPLSWWVGRKDEQMPEYVKVRLDGRYVKVFEWGKLNGVFQTVTVCDYITPEKQIPSCTLHVKDVEPISSVEYKIEEHLKQIKPQL